MTLPMPTNLVPDVVGLSAVTDVATQTSAIYFAAPQHRSTNTSPGPFFLQDNLGSFDADLINDMDADAVAFSFAADAGTSAVTLYSGLALAYREAHYVVDLTTTLSTPVIEYSNDYDSWAEVELETQTYVFDLSLTRRLYVIRWVDAGAHEYWRFRRATGSTAETAFSELWFRRDIGAITGDWRALLYDTRSGSRQLVGTILSDDLPTEDGPYSTSRIHTFTASLVMSGPAVLSLSIAVVVVTAGGSSAGRDLSVTVDDSSTWLSHDVVYPVVSLSAGTLTWDPPQFRSSTMYGAGSWSGTATIISAATVNNGDKTVNAVTFTTGQTLIHDSGVAKDIREVRISATTAALFGVGGLTFTIETSIDGSTGWTSVSNLKTLRRTRTTFAASTNEVVYQWDSTGARRFRRITVTGGGSISEVQFHEWLGTSNTFNGVNIYDMRSGSAVLVHSMLMGDYALSPFFIRDFITLASTEKTCSLLIRAVNTVGIESEGVGATASLIMTASSSEAPLTQGGVETLYNKTIDGGSNTYTNIPASALTDGTSGTGPFVRASSPSVTNIDVTDGALSVKGMLDQSFVLEITNTAGTLQHRIIADPNGSASNFATRVSGASATLANSPSLSTVVDFAAGGGIDSTGTNRFVLKTANQIDGDQMWSGAVIENSTAAGFIYADWRQVSLNVNGVTRRYLAVALKDAGGAAKAITTANIAAGQFVRVRFYGRLY